MAEQKPRKLYDLTNGKKVDLGEIVVDDFLITGKGRKEIVVSVKDEELASVYYNDRSEVSKAFYDKRNNELIERISSIVASCFPDYKKYENMLKGGFG